MKAAIYNPYLDTLGGGERYTLSFAKVLLDSGFTVDIFWPDESIREKIYERFGISLNGVRFVNDVKRGDSYDLCFWVSDGSIPTLKARKNFLHFQIPFVDVNGRSLINRMKLFRINKIICNSYFTKEFIDKEYGVESMVVYPPVPVGDIKSKRKENMILSVGRFSQLLQAKKQDVLVKVFRRLCKSGLKNWKLVLAGGVEIGTADYLKKLKEESLGFPIEIIQSPSYKEILNLYGKAKIYWSASGFGIDEFIDPKKVEHFGIAVVEAMAAGAVPLAVNKGGHKEIITNGEDGYLWKTKLGLFKRTKELIESPRLLKDIALKSKETAKKYGLERFTEEVKELI